MELCTVEIPVVELGPLLADDIAEARQESARAVESLRALGLILVRDPRVTSGDNDRYLNLMTAYFQQEETALMADVRPEVNRQAGFMEWYIEEARTQAYADRIDALAPDRRPFPHAGPNPFGRFFWHYGPRRAETLFPEATSPNVIPAAFARQWEETMNAWGEKMHEAGVTLTRMIALGLGIPSDEIVSRLTCGQHLLAPTGSLLTPFEAERTDPRTGETRTYRFRPEVGAVLSHVHDDFNLLTGHGPGRFPGLIAWTRDGRPFRVTVPRGCLLWQVGQQLERLTGGYFEAGLHQVAVLPATIEAMQDAKENEEPLVRISSTFFLHHDWDMVLEPIGRFRTSEALERYPAMLAGEHARSVFREMNM